MGVSIFLGRIHFMNIMNFLFNGEKWQEYEVLSPGQEKITETFRGALECRFSGRLFTIFPEQGQDL